MSGAAKQRKRLGCWAKALLSIFILFIMLVALMILSNLPAPYNSSTDYSEAPTTSGQVQPSSTTEPPAMTTTTLLPTEVAEIVGSKFTKDPSYGGDGAVIYNIEIKNLTDQYIDTIKLEVTFYDKTGNIVTTDNCYVSGISPYSKGAGKGYATYYKEIDNAHVRIVDYY